MSAREVLASKGFQLTFASVASAAAGAGVAYLVLNKQLEAKYSAIAEEEIAEARARYKVTVKAETPQELAEALADDVAAEENEFAAPPILDETAVTEVSDLVKDLGYDTTAEEIAEELAARENDSAEEPPPAEEELDPALPARPKQRNVFRDARSANSHFDYATEVPKRTEDKPYIITQEEFLNTEKDYIQSTLTYFELDDTLVDEREEVIPNMEEVVGEAHLRQFGYGSTDRNTVHVRNDKLQLEFEILRSEGSYVKEVLGMDDSETDDFIQHSEKRGRARRRRAGDWE